MAGQIREKGPDYNDEAFRIKYEENPNLFSVRLHYKGKFKFGPIDKQIMSYEGGKVELFDCCDGDTFGLSCVDSWAFRVGLRFGEFAACVYHDPEVEGMNGLRPLNKPKNVLQFVNLSGEHKFLDVYFVHSGNTDRLEDLDDEYGNIRISSASADLIKKRQTEKANVKPIEFQLDDIDTTDRSGDRIDDGYEADGKGLNDIDDNIDDDIDDDRHVDMINDGYEADGGGVNDLGDEADDVNDEDLDFDDILYGQEEDCFDDGELGCKEPVLGAAFLDQVEEDVVIADNEDGESDQGEAAPNVEVPKMKNKGPILTTFEKRVIDGETEELRTGKKKKYKGPYGRHGVQFKERRGTGWVESTSEDSNGVLGDKQHDSEFESGDSTSPSEGEKDVQKLSCEDRKKKRYVHFNDKYIKNPRLFPGLVFSSSGQFKEVMTWYAAVMRKDIWFTCNETHRIGARCQYPCDWSIWLSRDKNLNNTDLVIKSISRKHKNCVSTKRRKIIKSTWLAKVLQDWFRLLPDMTLSVLRVGIDKKFGLMITSNQARRTREKALKAIEGDHNEQYKMIWDYIEELKSSHPGSTVFAEYEDDLEDRHAGLFKRIYVCLKPLVEGFKVGCRKVIGLDGCHTKGLHKQQILSAVALDPNNGWWPICWAIVEKENKETWKWFIETLADDITIADEEQYVFMSDKQKGLESALHEILPRVQHRNCVQHIYRNFKKSHGSQILRDRIWACARASTEHRFHAAMFALKETDSAAYTWLEHNGGNPKHWSRAFFPTNVKSDMLCNNLSESFNAFILSARNKPIITMLERIRRLCMERIKDRRLAIGTKPGPLCPRITKILDKRTNCSDGMQYAWNGADGFEVFSPNGEQFKVDLRKRECSCRIWQLTGIPCTHSIPAIYSRKQEPINWVDDCYKVATFGWLYENVLQPMTGPSEWTKQNRITLLPPKYVRQAGRPKLSRRKHITEIKKVGAKDRLTKWNKQACKYCGGETHNVRTCPKKKADVERVASSQPIRSTRKRRRGSTSEMQAAVQEQHHVQSTQEAASTHPRKCSQNRRKGSTNQVKAAVQEEEQPQTTPLSLADKLEQEQAEHEAYLLDLYEWLNSIKQIVPNTRPLQQPGQTGDEHIVPTNGDVTSIIAKFNRKA